MGRGVGGHGGHRGSDAGSGAGAGAGLSRRILVTFHQQVWADTGVSDRDMQLLAIERARVTRDTDASVVGWKDALLTKIRLAWTAHMA